MKLIKFSSLLFFFLALGLNVNAQDEDIITESSEPAEDMYVDDIVAKRLIVENKVLPYEPIREADIAWEKRIWRLVDVREKMNLPFMNPEKPFFTILKELAENGDITLFDDEKFTEPLDDAGLQEKLYSVDTISDFDYDTYEEVIKVIPSEIFWEDIKQYRIKEVWFFDEEAAMLKCRILSIAPVINLTDDETGEYKGQMALFYVYYPEAREFLAKHRVFNDYNDMAPMTWYDLFESRYFASYIYKKSNVLDLRLQDQIYGYENEGRDRLLESEKIKMELFNFEHDLWEY